MEIECPTVPVDDFIIIEDFNEKENKYVIRVDVKE